MAGMRIGSVNRENNTGDLNSGRAIYSRPVVICARWYELYRSRLRQNYSKLILPLGAEKEEKADGEGRRH